jgi:hypothetical protein
VYPVGLLLTTSHSSGHLMVIKCPPNRVERAPSASSKIHTRCRFFPLGALSMTSVASWQLRPGLEAVRPRLEPGLPLGSSAFGTRA